MLACAALARCLQGFQLRAFGLDAANAQPLALAQRVKAQAHMLAQHAALIAFDQAGCLRNVTVQKLAERPLADKADAGRVFFLRVWQANLVSYPAYLGLFQFAHREQRFGQLRLVQPVQKVALVFGRVQALEQFMQARGLVVPHPGVVPSGYFFGTQAHGVVQKRLEFDLGVAQNIRVGRAACRILAQELGKNTVFVAGRKVDVFNLDADHIRYRCRIDKVDV